MVGRIYKRVKQNKNENDCKFGIAFALTVHKTQGLTLPDITIPLDSQM